MNLVRIVLADDHSLVRAGIRALCQSLPGVEVVAEANDGIEAFEMAAAHQPDVVLMDISMRAFNGLAAMIRIKDAFPTIRVILLTMHAESEYVLEAMRAGASGYLLKDCATIDLELALQAVVRGENYLSPSISKQVMDSYARRAGDVPRTPLTARQREILRLIAEGQSTKQIAFALGISTKTVEAHRTQVMKRLEIRDVAGLVRYAIRIGLVSADK